MTTVDLYDQMYQCFRLLRIFLYVDGRTHFENGRGWKIFCVFLDRNKVFRN